MDILSITILILMCLSVFTRDESARNKIDIITKILEIIRALANLFL